MFLQVILVSAKLNHYLGRCIKKRHFKVLLPLEGKAIYLDSDLKVKAGIKVGSHNSPKTGPCATNKQPQRTAGLLKIQRSPSARS